MYDINEKTFNFAILLFEHQHLEESIKIFDIFTHSENPFKEDALLYILNGLCLLEECTKAIELYEINHFPSGLPYNIENNLANCYFKEGETQKVLAIFQNQLKLYPLVGKDFYEGQNIKIPKNIVIKKLVKKMIEDGISPLSLFEYLLPVYLEIREVCCGFFDEFLISDTINEYECNLFKYLASVIYLNFGLRLFPIRYFAEHNHVKLLPMSKIFIYKNPSIIDSLIMLQEDYYKMVLSDGFYEAGRSFQNREGEILGYPSCCIESAESIRYSNTPEKNASPYSKLLEKISSMNLFFYLNSDLLRENEHIPLTYFVFEFYPCKPDCPNAALIGKRYVEEYRKVDNKIADIFENILFELHLRQFVRWFDPEENPLLREEVMEHICNYLKLNWKGVVSLRQNLESNMGH